MLFISIIYNILLPILFFLYFPFYLKKQLKRGGLDAGFWERFGFFSTDKKQLLNRENNIWIHAVSVGETVAALNFINFWLKKDPSANIIISTTTTTGQKIAREKSPENVTVIYMPIDFRGAIRRAFKVIKPTKLIIFEVEIWPNLLIQAQKFNAEVSLVNGRISDNSYRGFKKHGWFFRPIFALFDKMCVQTAIDAERFAEVSDHKLSPVVCNTMKFDQAPEAASHITRAAMEERFITEQPVIFNAASTHPGEEKLILETYQQLKTKYPQLTLLLVPRHVERTKEIETIFTSMNLDYTLFSDQNSAKNDIILVNVTGELLSLISVSDIVYVGKSLAGNEGGHNIIEPAVFGKPILHGDNMQNFRDVATIFQTENASIIVTEKNLPTTLESLIANPTQMKNYGDASLNVVKKYAGAMAKTFDQINNSEK